MPKAIALDAASYLSKAQQMNMRVVFDALDTNVAPTSWTTMSSRTYHCSSHLWPTLTNSSKEPLAKTLILFLETELTSQD